MYLLPSHLRLLAAAFVFLMGSNAVLPAVAAVHMVVFCCEEIEAPPPAPPCHPVEEEAPDHKSVPAALICCLDETAIEPAPVPRSQEVHTFLKAVAHPALITDARPIQVFEREGLEQVPRGIPSVGLPVFNATLLI